MPHLSQDEKLALAKPDLAEVSDLEAWYMCENIKDQRHTNRLQPNVPVGLDELEKYGVLYWKLDTENLSSNKRLAAIREVRGYTYEDIISISPKLLPNYEQMIENFFKEHIHLDEEIRFIIDGSGYFDIRSINDKWIRIACKKGDMIVLPEGIYHRFTLDDNNYIKAMRLFVGEPVWTPYNRPAESYDSRKKYIKFLQNSSLMT